MSHRSAQVKAMLAILARRFFRSAASGFTILGATMYGGAPVGAAWLRTVADPSRPDEHPVDSRPPDDPSPCATPVSDDVVEREVADGVAAIEAFLAAQCRPPRGHDDLRASDHPTRRRGDPA